MSDRPQSLLFGRDPGWRSTLFTGLLWLCLGLVFVWTNWDGLSEWWRIINLDYSEVKETPFLPIWTSGKGVLGVFFICAGATFLFKAASKRKRQKAEPGTGGNR